MLVVACELSTTAYGIPYGGAPKSGCRLVDPAFIEASHATLLVFTGKTEMSAFQMLLLGKTSQLVPGIGACPGRGALDAGADRAAPVRARGADPRPRGVPALQTHALRHGRGAVG